MLLFLALTAWVVYCGVEKGIEKYSRYIMPGLLYSGLSWPNFDMSDIASMLGMLMPMTYGGDTLRDILLSGTAPALYKNCLVMLLGGFGCQLVASLLFYLRRKHHFWTGEGESA